MNAYGMKVHGVECGVENTVWKWFGMKLYGMKAYWYSMKVHGVKLQVGNHMVRKYMV